MDRRLKLALRIKDILKVGVIALWLHCHGWINLLWL
jgi:hypothetical protein